MKMVVGAVLDKKVGAYLQPQFFRTKGEAQRAFMDAVAAENSHFAKHSEDFVFCCLGSYDDNDGTFECPKVPEILLSAVDCLVKA